MAGARDRGRRHLGDVEGAGAAPLLRDRRRARALADLRRRSRCFFVAQPARDDRQRPRSGRTRCRRRSSRSPTTAAPRAAPAGEGRRRRPALRPARLQALGRPRVRRPRTLRRRRHRLRATPIPNRLRCGRSPRTRAATPRSRGACEAATEVARGRQGLHQQRQQVRARTSCASALGTDERERRVRRAERRRLLEAARRRHRQGAATSSASPTSRPPTRWRRAASTSGC